MEVLIFQSTVNAKGDVQTKMIGFDLPNLFSDVEETLPSESVLKKGASRQSYIFLLLEVRAQHKLKKMCRIQVLG